MKEDASVDQNLNYSWNSGKVKYFKIFRNFWYFPDDMRKSIPSLTFVSMDRSKVRLVFLYIDLNIRNNLTSSWKKSGQQTALNYTSGRPTLSVDLVSRSSKLDKIAIVLIVKLLIDSRWTAPGKFALRVASWVPVSGGKFNVEFMGNVNNDRVAGAEIFPPLANKQNWIWLVEFATSLIFAPIPFTWF